MISSLIFSRKLVRSTSSLRPRQEDSRAWNSALWRISSICRLSLASISAIMRSTMAFFTGSFSFCGFSNSSIKADTPRLAMS